MSHSANRKSRLIQRAASIYHSPPLPSSSPYHPIQSSRTKRKRDSADRNKNNRLTVLLEDSENLVTGNGLDLSDTVGITEHDTNLGRGESFSGEFENVVRNLVRGDLEPSGSGALVGKSGSGCAEGRESVFSLRDFGGGASCRRRDSWECASDGIYSSDTVRTPPGTASVLSYASIIRTNSNSPSARSSQTRSPRNSFPVLLHTPTSRRTTTATRLSPLSNRNPISKNHNSPPPRACRMDETTQEHSLPIPLWGLWSRPMLIRR